VFGGAGLGFVPRYGGEVDVSIGVFGVVRAVAGASVALHPFERKGDFTVRYLAFVARTGIGLRVPGQSWEVRTCAVVETYVADGRGIDRKIGVLPGIEAAFRYGFALGGGFDALAGVSLTYAFRRHELSVLGDEVLTTERLAATLFTGIAWGPP
jgi:hypothetical protein